MASIMMAESRWNAGKRRVFQSVFQTDITQPMQHSTSTLRNNDHGGHYLRDHSAPSRKKAGDSPPLLRMHSDAPHNQSNDQARFDKAWHIVTSRIALPSSVTAEDSFGSLPASQDVDESAFQDAVRVVLDPASRNPLAIQTDDILSWHISQVRHHFVSQVLPLLSICDSYADQTQVLLGSIRTLEAAHRQYAFGLSLIMREMQQDAAEDALRKFRRDLHAIVGNSMSASLMRSLRTVLSQLMAVILEVPNAPPHQPGYASTVDGARKEFLQLVDSLCNVGLAGEKFQILFAELLNGIMVAYISKSFAGRWESDQVSEKTVMPFQAAMQPRCMRKLNDWIENHYSRLAVEVSKHLSNVQVSWTDVEKWKEIAIGRLAALRISELFDIVISWPNSDGGVEDLRYSVATPQRRLQLTDAFSEALSRRLLHPGRSTLDILRTYIAMIHTFQKLDQSRVLLDRVAYPLQLYLCTREDAVRIIVTSLLTTPQEASSEEARKTRLVELVRLLNDPDQYRTERQDEEWDDLTWVPAPVDAGSNYKRRKTEDVIGTLISALGTPEVFIREFQSIIGERLLSDDPGLEQEIVVLDLLKKRFGESSLQACDVMIKDIQDSRRLDSVILRGAMNHPDKVKRDWTLHTKILSRLFWPNMGDDTFRVPSGVGEMQTMYETIFEHLKPSRKIKWLNHLGQATVELELEDRTINEKVRTYEAAVIDAFSEDSLNDRAPGWTFEDLWQHLMMDEDLLAAALEFWEKKDVLRKLPDGHYVILERLSDRDQSPETDTRAAAGSSGADPMASASPRKKSTVSGKEKQQQQVYWQFIVGMLTNSSPAMPLGQIAMMLKMLIAEGFPWSNEELQEFLADKISSGELELNGGKYKLVKK